MISKAKLRQYQQLSSKKLRQKYGLFVVEGQKSVNELVASDWPVESILCTSTFLSNYTGGLEDNFNVVSMVDFLSISQLKNPQEILAIARFHQLRQNSSSWQIALDGINDPGNLGTIIRIADWYGINTIYASEDTVDLYNNKVIQSTMGSFLRVNVIQGNLLSLLAEKTVFATLLNGQNIRSLPPLCGGVLLIGNEANGIKPELLANLCHTAINIPGAGTAESLNAAMATAICCERLVGG